MNLRPNTISIPLKKFYQNGPVIADQRKACFPSLIPLQRHGQHSRWYSGCCTGVATAAVVGVGTTYSIKAHKKRRALLERSRPTKEHLQNVAQRTENQDNPHLQKYQKFTRIKIEQQEKFYREFQKANKLFLTASSLYGSGAAGKAVVAGAALAGVGVLSNPVALAGVTAVGVAGGIGMALTSHHLITGHNKQHRYEKYITLDTPALNRNFLVSADLLTSPQQGANLRAGFYHLIEQQDRHRQDLLLEIANDTDRVFNKTLHSTDEGFKSRKTKAKDNLENSIQRMRSNRTSTEATDHLSSKRQSTFSNRLKANALAAGQYFKALGHGDIKHAIQQDRDTRMQHVDRLCSRKSSNGC